MPATPAAVSVLRGAVRHFASHVGVSDPPLADIGVALSEAVTNVVMHSYRADPQPGTVKVTALHAARELRIVVEDHGQGCAPRSDSPGIGLGMGLMTALASRVEFRGASPHGTEVHLCFALGTADA